jgi:hypothetical protein
MESERGERIRYIQDCEGGRGKEGSGIRELKGGVGGGGS